METVVKVDGIKLRQEINQTCQVLLVKIYSSKTGLLAVRLGRKEQLSTLQSVTSYATKATFS